MRGRLLFLVLAPAGAIWLASAAHAAEGHEAPGTWLNWLQWIRIGGHSLAPGAAWIMFSWALLVAAILAVLSFLMSRRLAVRAKPWQLMAEAVVGGIRALLEGPMGERAPQFLPLIGSMMIYIACMNLLGLVPGAISPTASLNTTAALALFSFVTIHYVGFRESGIGYVKHFVEGVPLRFSPKAAAILSLLALLPVAAMVSVSHLVTALFLPITLAFRLYGNIYGEEQVVGSLAHLATQSGAPWVPIQLPNMLLGIITAVVQAIIFGMLTAVNISLVLHHDSSGHEAHAS
jgi:F-type H+-transporting ATPase subunit a